MTPAAFDTRRRMLGLSVRDTAQVCGRDGGPVSEKAVNNWIRGEAPVPLDAQLALEALELRMEDQVAALVDLITDKTMIGPEPLVRYRTQEALDDGPHACELPLGAHAMMIAWADDQLAAQGVETDIIWGEA